MPLRLLAFLVALTPAVAAAAPPIGLAVDLSEAPRRIVHVREVIPARPGPLALAYPKWIPGQHSPSGPIVDVAGLRITAGGKPLAWQRDPVELHLVRCEVPAGATAVEVAFDYLARTPAEGLAVTSAKLIALEWNLVVIYPHGPGAEALRFAPRVRLPAGWKLGTALETARAAGAEVAFRAVPLETLLDSPVLAGAHFATIPLDADHVVHLAADSPAALEVPPATVAGWKRLVREAQALFGVRPYRRYCFLLALSDAVYEGGLEHLESSNNRAPERALVEDEMRAAWSTLLPHEYVHSWNGKFRRPRSLTPPGYLEPMHGDLLWVYEGLTSYLGFVLAARSGLLPPEWVHDNLARTAAWTANRAGREWRPLGDAAVAAQVLYGAPQGWASWRRASKDFYFEGVLLWLEVDARIRRETNGARSIDDFCRRFHGATRPGARVHTYAYDDVLAALDEVAPGDWRAFFAARVTSVAARPPDGLAAAGWRLGANDRPNRLLAENEREDGILALAITPLGLFVKADGTVTDVVPGLPAARGGLAPGMKLLGVDGRLWSKPALRDALRARGRRPGAIELLAANVEQYQVLRVTPRGGESYPHLERLPARPDLLGAILSPRAK
jgi:predicted metalloprotease with PDZ domain